MSAKEDSDVIQDYFKTFVEMIVKITESYRYEGKIDEALLIFESNKPILDFDDVRSEDKAKFLIQNAKILQQSKFIKEFNYDYEIKILTEAKNLAINSNAKDLIADALDLIGTCIYSKGILEGEYHEAIDFFNEAFNIRKEIDDILGFCKSYFNLGLYHENIKDSNEENLHQAFELYQKGLKIAIEENFKLEQAYFFRHLASFYHEKDRIKSLQYHLNSATLREEIGFKLYLHSAYFEVAMEYLFLKDLEKSFHYFKKAYSWAQKMSRIVQHKVIIFRRGNQMIESNQTETAIKYYKLLLKSAQELKDLDGINEIEQEIKNIKNIK